MIVDINMPQMDGLTFLETVRRKDRALASVPALVTSTESAEADFEAARVAGANYYLVKPIDQAKLVEFADVAVRCAAMNEFLTQFLIESRELVEQATEGLLVLEQIACATRSGSTRCSVHSTR